MSEAEKTQVRYNYILSKTADVHGDAEKTIKSTANQVKVMKAQIEIKAAKYSNECLNTAANKNDFLLKRERLLRAFLLAMICSAFFTYNHPVAYLVLGIFNCYVIVFGIRTIRMRHEFEVEKINQQFCVSETRMKNR
jgi:hypothetical protein